MSITSKQFLILTAVLGALLLILAPRPARAQALEPSQSDPDYSNVMFRDLPTVSWTRKDELWYKRNRTAATIGKLLTVGGIALIIGGAVQEQDGMFYGGWVTKVVGELTWAGADLRAAKVMRKKGVDVSKKAGIAGVVGAVIFSPILWIAGPIQSSQLRKAHEELTYGRASLDPIRGRTGGLQMRLSF